nr:phospholipid-transporting ATPase 2-like isoform X2 [Ipomoea batatas]GMD83391.1 phospholipid-transporting ATPase 2-like isoform X2 [Ipomoea batatas]GMD86955.1 phospholipid-transporting ATPase 2-like isoform X2 [Ipomoea batatas]
MRNYQIIDFGFVRLNLTTTSRKCGQQTRMFSEAVDYYAQLGLQTLCLAWRELEEDEYQEWSLMFKDASSSLGMVAEVCQRIEHDLKIIGVAAIEDKLQVVFGGSSFALVYSSTDRKTSYSYASTKILMAALLRARV